MTLTADTICFPNRASLYRRGVNFLNNGSSYVFYYVLSVTQDNVTCSVHCSFAQTTSANWFVIGVIVGTLLGKFTTVTKDYALHAAIL